MTASFEDALCPYDAYRGSPGVETPVQGRQSLLCALETDLCPRTGRLNSCGLRAHQAPWPVMCGLG